MSAEKTTVKDVIEMLKQFPEDMLVVGYGISGFYQGENFDGVNAYKQVFDEHSDGFVPIKEETINELKWKLIKDKDAIGFGEECVVLSPITKDNIFSWCDLD